ncbi:DNA replication protein DnaC [Paraburkholderia sp. JPY465]|uniref:ATP-binding protein n=1 Tax=Paraburkholderia sp. JPY465 TaxID=3042285 RepID=UPI003D25F2DB
MNRTEQLQERANALRMYGLLAHWSEIADASWVEPLLQWEEQERARRSLERRIRDARLGNFKPLADFDWAWPKRIDRGALEELMALEFVREKSNVVLIGPNGVGKVAHLVNQEHFGRSVAMQAPAQRRVTVECGQFAEHLASSGKERRVAVYERLVREVQCECRFTYSNRHADLLFELVSRRYGAASTVVTTNKPFAAWSEVFPNAACVVSLVDRLVHRAEVIAIEGESYRVKEARERAEQRSRRRNAARPEKKP